MPRPRGIAVIGSGAAGLMAALGAAHARDAILVTDGATGRSNSIMAQGGLQLPHATAASEESFFRDIVRSARVDLDETLVRTFIAHVRSTVESLERWGLELDRAPDGSVVRRLAGGLSEARIVSVRDQIGPAIIKVLRARVQESDIEVVPNTQVVDLRPNGEGLRLETRTAAGDEGEIVARAVVCCTGGLTYREAQRRRHPTTNPRNENHVLFDALARLGLAQVHADFFQYQPFGIVTPEPAEVGKCVPESIVNFGVRLLDRFGKEIGDIRQDRYALTELMFRMAQEGRAVRLDDDRPGLWLTLEDVDEATLETVFPKVHQHLQRTGQAGGNLLVFPFLHYHLGGLRLGPQCRSEIPGLFLAGEITGGLHGRNRLMGNGITDSLVHGLIAGEAARDYVAG